MPPIQPASPQSYAGVLHGVARPTSSNPSNSASPAKPAVASNPSSAPVKTAVGQPTPKPTTSAGLQQPVSAPAYATLATPLSAYQAGTPSVKGSLVSTKA